MPRSRSASSPGLIALVTCSLCAVHPASRADEPSVQQVLILGTSQAQPVMTDPGPVSRSSVTRAGLELLGGAAQTSLYAPLEMVPSVIQASPDPFGLSPTRSISIRGKTDFHLGKNVEGLPLGGIVGGTDLFDLENVRQIDVYRGGLQAHQGLGISDATGVIDETLLGPQARPGVLVKQGLGSYSFRRTFVRLDTGFLAGTDAAVFMSAASTATDKWTGSGHLSRDNFTAALGTSLGSSARLDLTAVYNRFKGDAYRSLSYAQAQAIKDNYKFDYNASLTGVSATDVNYHDFNRVQYETWAVLGKLDVDLGGANHVVVKPYAWNNRGAQYSASGSTVQIWTQVNTNQGIVAEYEAKPGDAVSLRAGYWWQSMAAPPPPTEQRRYTVTPAGDLTFANWATLSRVGRYHADSPYVQLTSQLGATVVGGGVRYMALGAPAMQYYKTAGLPNLPYSQIFDAGAVADTNAAVVSKRYGVWLPNLNVQQALNTNWVLSANYGRNFGRPDWGPQASNFIGNETAFVARGVVLQTLVDRVRPELSDQLDLSARYQGESVLLTSTVFYAHSRNRQVFVTDPALGGLSYYQGTAATTGKGLELEAAAKLGPAWLLFGSATLASETFDDDTPTLSGGGLLGTRGKQIPNTTRQMLKVGATYRWQSFTVSPLVSFIGRRYGDSVQLQPIGGYAIAGLNAGYEFAGGLRLTLAAQNLFDRRYVSQITPNDTNLNGAASYYAGAPRTLALAASARF